MGDLIDIQLGLGSTPGRLVPEGTARLINAMAVDAGTQAKFRFPLYPAPGLTAFGTATNGGETRGLFEFDRYLLQGAGRQLYRYDQSGAAEALGAIPGDGPMYFARNRRADPQCIIVSDGLTFVLENFAELSELGDPDLPPAIRVLFVDGYFLFLIADGRVFHSALEDKIIAPADFFTAEALPDGLVGGVVRRREVWLMGPKSIEVWVLTSDPGATAAFERLPGGFVEFGCASGASIAKLEEAVLWLGHDGTVRMASEYSGTRISNPAVERSIAAQADKAAIKAHAYSRGGHSFYVLTGDAFTWVYDLTLARKVGHELAWHERHSYGLKRWRAQWHASFAGKDLTGDYETGRVYAIDPDADSEAGGHLVMDVTVPIVHAYPSRLRYNALFLDTVPGQGLNSVDAHAADPKAVLKHSKDGGVTWSNERAVSTGKIGESRTRIRINRLGITREDGLLINVKQSAGVNRGLVGGKADVDRLSA